MPAFEVDTLATISVFLFDGALLGGCEVVHQVHEVCKHVLAMSFYSWDFWNELFITPHDFSVYLLGVGGHLVLC